MCLLNSYFVPPGDSKMITKNCILKMLGKIEIRHAYEELKQGILYAKRHERGLDKSFPSDQGGKSPRGRDIV